MEKESYRILVVDVEKAVLSVVHGAKNSLPVTVGRNSMVTSFYSGQDGNKLLQRPLQGDSPVRQSDVTIGAKDME